MNNEKLLLHIRWAQEYTEDYIKNNEFDPFRFLTGQENKKDKIFSACCEFLAALDDLSTDFEKAQKTFL